MLGIGSFGTVSCCRRKGTSSFVAVKCIKKARLFRRTDHSALVFLTLMIVHTFTRSVFYFLFSAAFSARSFKFHTIPTGLERARCDDQVRVTLPRHSGTKVCVCVCVCMRACGLCVCVMR
jgi:hypothetical protein